MKSLWRFLKAEEFDRCRNEINDENRRAISLLARAGLPLSIANMLSNFVIMSDRGGGAQGLWMVLYFGLLLLIDKKVLPRDFPRATIMLYVLEIPAMLISILLGTVWDPNYQAVTYLLFIMAMPVFILDRPIRLLGIFTGWTALFLILSASVKDPGIFRGDLFHIIEFYMAATAVTYVVLRIRLENLKNLERTRYHLEHDSLTGMRNRNALVHSLNHYVGKPLFVLLGDLDQLTLYNDFYGHDIGDNMLINFAQSLVRYFGEMDTYRYGGDEVLCIAVGTPVEECLDRLEKVRKRLRHNEFDDGRVITLTCAFGYVTATPQSEKEFQDMLQLADIHAHKAKSVGRDKTVGGTFDAAHLRAGIMESNISTHARVFETNQLTGLPSMSYFISRADELLTSVAVMERGPGVVFLNLLHFRDFNDEFGYAEGDELIRRTAGWLRQYFPKRHICCVTGNQFGVLCYQDEVEMGIRRLNEQLMCFKPGFPIYCKAGFARYTGQESSISLMDKAKVAHDSIYDSKDIHYRFYDAKLDEEDRFRQYIVSHVDEAIERGYLKVFYQPIMRSVTGEVCNEEALSRWDDPKYGFLPPFQFIPVLEEKRLIYKVNLNVVRQVLKDFQTKRERGVPCVPVSVNLSRYDFTQCDMVKAICDLVDATDVPRSLIKVEITESALIDNQDLVKREMERFRENGFEVWMDDFGSEYSTLNLLQELNFDLIKIDMQFMKNFGETGKNAIIVSNVIDMARQMGITTLVEGVETQEQYRILRKLGAEKVQGYLFNRPNPLEYIIERNLAGTGLPFERPAESNYYEKVGRIDLNEPLVYDENNPFLVNNELPAGVLEYRDGHFVCIRGKDRFLHLLFELGMVETFRKGTERMDLMDPAPESLRTAAERCRESKGWVEFDIDSGPGEERYSFYLRRVAENKFSESVALLAVLLTTQAL